MPKPKVPTPQDLYWARKNSQDAYFPPGLINQGNTCFMNSVLQGLIATPLLADLVQFRDIPDQVQKYSNTPLISRRSPQLTNGHGRGGVDERIPVTMPIGDRFIDILYRAWDVQSQRSRESLNPKELLSALGQKYDQYLDFAQQDAHEFLRILLDAMRMEELDIIKQRQPQLLKQPRKRRRSSRPHPSSPSSPSQSSSDPDTLLSFPDMIFGGRFTSILVCQKCKNISQTYEDFNDVSLSLKAEDYGVVHHRTRERFKKLAKKFAALPSTSLVAAANPPSSRAIGGGSPNKETSQAEGDDAITNTQDNGRMNLALQIQRSSSVPPSPREREDSQMSEKLLPHLVTLRRSMEHLQSETIHPLSGESSSSASGSDAHLDRLQEPNRNSMLNGNGTKDSFSSVQEGHSSAAGEREMESDGSNVLVNGAAFPRSTPSGDKHIDFMTADQILHGDAKDKSKGKKKRDSEDGWAKLGRRISTRVGISLKKDKDKGTEKEKRHKRSKSADRPISSSSAVSSATELQKDRDKEKGKGHEKRNKSQDRRSNASSNRVASSADVDPPNSISIKEAPSIPDANSTLSSSPGTAPSIKISISSCDANPARSDIGHEPVYPPPVIAEPRPVRPLPPQSQTSHRRGLPLHTMHAHLQDRVQRVSGSVRRSRSPKPPKQSKEEEEYLRRLLADVGPAPVRVLGEGEVERNDGHHKKTHLQPSGDRGSKAGNGNVGSWLPLAAVSQFSGLEECLRMFTAVEVLDGENMVGCRRCWKIQNGYIKGNEDGDDSDEEEEETRDYPGERERQSTSQTIVSESSTSSAAGYISTPATSVEEYDRFETGEFRSPKLPALNPNSLVVNSAPAIIPFASDTREPSTATPRPLYQTKSRSPGDETIIVTPSISPRSRIYQSLPPTPDLNGVPQYATSLIPSRSAPSTPGGLPIPLIATTPAADSPTSDKFASTDGSSDTRRGNSVNGISPTDTKSSSGELLEVGAGEEGTSEDEVKKKRRGMVFSDSLVVPSGRSGRVRQERRDSPDEWLTSEAESVTTDASLDGSTGGSVTTGSEGSESRRESLEEGARLGGTPAAPPGLGNYHRQTSTSHTNTIPVRGSETISVAKPLSKPKKKKETILRPAYKRYLISDPPPVLVIHLKRFQQLGDHSSHSSGLASFAHKFAANFTNPQTNAQYMARNDYGSGGFGGFGGFGGGGFKKLEDFVSFPEWLDLAPFLAPKKEHIVPMKKSSSKSKGGVVDAGEGKGQKEDERCMYRLYAVVVHIGNMLGGHYVSYVALPNQPPSLDINNTKGKAKAGTTNGLPKSNNNFSSSSSTDSDTANPALTAGLKSGKRQWAYISDTHVRVTSLEEVLRARAYLCMYERV
ncbi:hypothetical protein AGABI1DRAFT_108823 [Agaricus bisporus var. burnettii JB137-S8]|uniref:ubiquitinyl hydrolase 1 n=1 Tax=Agaricus bisporus var. burnettii (strain JB137-S8 / ATCC MYA-4627 / FGSC 10392) TaxID=597362 RepID=K5X087_AGABU|nr:uncharacterized protein AGABI1DRAFT_108823 [Agaricus bisporus var. burnettii JB137-S8]EKM76523.1 hypothetical protein AGABI1DRAFT_108823 [Agaricus bisporus var. burnettii JB137-S8]